MHILLYKLAELVTLVISFAEGVPLGNSEADQQLLEAAKAGDVDTVKVSDKQFLYCTDKNNICSLSRLIFEKTVENILHMS